MAAPQPNFQQLSQDLASMSAEVALIPNMPAMVGIGNVLQQLQVQAQQATAQQAQQHQQTQQTLNQLVHRIDGVQDSVDRLPMLLFNAIASHEAPLQYPPGLPANIQFPVSKCDILRLNGANAQIVLQALGIAVHANSTVTQRRQKILDFLGCAIRA